ncbi:MAG: septal ring lytic transglycosylase RlpA family protein [candidate division WOR-3 bacterium]|nr:MAG: septal ring lytic transglycosylase RlpA family protein [candidate division WOR-3 bacterium]
MLIFLLILFIGINLDCASQCCVGSAHSGFVQYGKASYYGDEFHGRKTSSGEVYDKWKYTCAHRELPFGTRVRVTNLSNNKTVVVRVNDRGPFVKGRVIDLSFVAAREIAMLKAGIVKVKIEVVK